MNDDVKRAVQAGIFVSAQEHYVIAGYFEDRLPRRCIVDEAWYLDTYQDVGDAIRDRPFENAQKHFDEFGFKEGRLPAADWSL